MGIKSEMTEKAKNIEVNTEGIIEGRIKIGMENLREMIEIYVNEDMERKLQRMRGWMEEREEGSNTIRGEDFNARTGEGGVEWRMLGS